jgi:hypothetical protein
MTEEIRPGVSRPDWSVVTTSAARPNIEPIRYPGLVKIAASIRGHAPSLTPIQPTANFQPKCASQARQGGLSWVRPIADHWKIGAVESQAVIRWNDPRHP